MVTLAQAQERAESWVNGGVPGYQRREARVTEFDLGYVLWAEDRTDGPTSDSGGCRLVLARGDGGLTLWPALPVDEVIRRYVAEYGPRDGEAPAPERRRRVDLEATSFLLSPPQWLQEAADKLGIPDHRPSAAGAAVPPPPAAEPEPVSASAADAADELDVMSAVPVPDNPASDDPWDGGTSTAPTGAVGWSDTNTHSGADGPALPPPAISGFDGAEVDPAASARSEARTALLPGGSGLPPTAIAPAVDHPEAAEPEAPLPAWATAPPAPPAPPAGAPLPPPAPPFAGPTPPPPPGFSGAPLPPAGPGRRRLRAARAALRWSDAASAAGFQ